MKIKFSIMTLALFYIILNLWFYKVSVHNYSNLKLFLFTMIFAIVEVFLFVYLFSYLKEMPKFIGLTFIITIIIVNIGRILLLSSPIFNDFVNSSFIASVFIGVPRIILIFMCIVLSVYFYENKIYLLFFSSLLGIVVAILLYLDFDTNISAILRTIMALFIAVYTYKKWKEKIVIEEEGESDEN